MAEQVAVPGSAGRLRGRTVLSLIVGHLASAPRVQKQARALREVGAKVRVRGNWLEPRLAEEDLSLADEIGIDFAPMTDLRPGVGWMSDRVRNRAAFEAFARLGWLSPRVLGPGAPELWRFSAAQPVDLVTVHSEPGLWVGERLVRAGRRVVVDFEDWFSHDQLPADRPESVRRWLRQLESFHLHRAQGCLATTDAMAAALMQAAGATRRPTVVRNCFPARTPEDSAAPERATGPVSFYWFSQTIGPGRGLEVLADALPLLCGEWALNVRGTLRGGNQWMESVFGSRLGDRIHVLPPLPNSALLAATREHDVGLALEVPYCRNKEVTASNKIHEYLRAGLAVIATRTEGQAEVMAASPGAGLLVPASDPKALADAMQVMIDFPRRLATCREAALAASRDAWDWEVHAQGLLRALEQAMEG